MVVNLSGCERKFPTQVRDLSNSALGRSALEQKSISKGMNKSLYHVKEACRQSPPQNEFPFALPFPYIPPYRSEIGLFLAELGYVQLRGLIKSGVERKKKFKKNRKKECHPHRKPFGCFIKLMLMMSAGVAAQHWLAHTRFGRDHHTANEVTIFLSLVRSSIIAFHSIPVIVIPDKLFVYS